ncbi:MAG: cation diffusion facilitator family transporter [Lachnospiraceae bacterium]|nr:cation diffusion facilitator family transporter [Lachnospiraceae bacterium]
MQKMINRVSFVGIFGNVLLCGFKFIAGIAGHSGAMVSDAIHSLSDVLATFIAWIGVRASQKVPDKEHPYGHERFECLASLILGMILMATSVIVGYSGLLKIFAGHYEELVIPKKIALAAAILSIVVKELMFWYTRHYAKLLNSSAFMADAWHHRSDAFSSVGSLIGIGGAMLGFPVLEPAASVVIALCIMKVAFDILKDAVDKMLDTSVSEEEEGRIRSFIASREGVLGVDMLHTRQFGNKIYIDVEISCEATLLLSEAHEIAERVHDEVEKEFPDTKHIMVHVNPATGGHS